MIVVKLMGGLGNQMFQYATGRRLALRHGVPLKLDLTFLEGNQAGSTPRRFALHCFAIEAAKATPWEVALMTGRGTSFVLHSVFARLSGAIRGFSQYRERWFQYDPEVLCLPDNVYLEGYWQSPRYFDDSAEIIRREFNLKTEPEGKNRELADRIDSVAAVSLHVRRGDYVTDPVTNAVHGICGPDYYDAAVTTMTQLVKEPEFFVFSDDPAWCREELKVSFPIHYIDNNRNQPHEDLRLMSRCRYHIIANSSFSWWGAWLCQQPDKLVITPKRWFNDPSVNTNDMIPVGWHRL
ncbi:alpha-1,2-fucosyltransferase [Trichlorobacter ammonificans]|uniref:O-antigen biosynthesis glycosyltransferase WbnK n=1 Tax=Trichlorobacter ammonificans TaxID=2916410 RepID=A0ABM9D784_9BACT|nr:alpha-1,2-fucosyltransferase [Trichlorobacter ammonificans]CAH2031084.1 putative O-antigen biosynthesis glycosyltransferase WbnK [Trichlorobacter ammonificans]